MSRHGSYTKKLYGKPLFILRVRCCNKKCRKTHAIIPSFSTPGCSTGTAELDSFIKSRAAGKTVDEAGQIFYNAGMSPDYPETIHRRLKKYSERIRTVFASAQYSLPQKNVGYAKMICTIAKILSGNNSAPATAINLNSFRFVCNPLLFSRINILFFPQNNIISNFSHNTPFRPPP